MWDQTPSKSFGNQIAFMVRFGARWHHDKDQLIGDMLSEKGFSVACNWNRQPVDQTWCVFVWAED